MRTHPEGHGPVRFGPPLPEDGLPVLPELAGVLAAAASRVGPEPVGGGPALIDAACGYGERRGLPAAPGRTALAPGAPALLTALTAAVDGDVLVPRPCASWWAPYARLLGRPVFHVPTPPESGGVPDPYALLETVRRMRAEGREPRLLVLSVADDPTATVAPPELLHETLEAAAGEGLHLVSDETWRDTLHDPRGTVLLSPAEMLPDRVTVVTDLMRLPAPVRLARRRRPVPGGRGGRRAARARPRRAHGPRRARGGPRRRGRRIRAVRARAGHRARHRVRAHARPGRRRRAPGRRRGGRPGPAPAVRPASVRRPVPARARAGRARRRRRPGAGGLPHRPAGHARGRMATGSATTSRHRASGCAPRPCWGTRPRSAPPAWKRTNRRNCHGWDAR